MTTDRREDIRQRLDELEATVSGLTQELVEANDRIRELEDRLEEDEGEDETAATTGENPQEETAATDGGDDGGNTDREDDIIVA